MLLAELDMAIERFRTEIQRHVLNRRLQRQIVAIGGASLLHLLVLLALIWQPAGALRGTYGDNGAEAGRRDGYGLATVQLLNASGRTDAASLTSPETAQVSPKPEKVAAKAQVSVELVLTPLSAMNQPKTAQNPNRPSTETALNTAFPEAGGAAAGSPNANDGLLDQIARCLPDGARPSLKFAKLDINVDAAGNLSAAPRLDVDISQLTQDEIRAGNQIIQAALQCGPYKLPTSETAMIEVVPDFSGPSATAP